MNTSRLNYLPAMFYGRLILSIRNDDHLATPNHLSGKGITIQGENLTHQTSLRVQALVSNKPQGRASLIQKADDGATTIKEVYQLPGYKFQGHRQADQGGQGLGNPVEGYQFLDPLAQFGIDPADGLLCLLAPGNLVT